MELRKVFVVWLSVSWVQIAFIECQDNKTDVDVVQDVIELRMPFINTTSDDEYYCMGVDIPWERRNISKPQSLKK